jgi:nucleoside-diphosphate-sugar epimerase
MKVLITGAAGNLGSFLARSMLGGPHELRLLIHRKPLTYDISGHPATAVIKADLGDPAALPAVCQGVDCIVHFAGVLFAPRPEKFLPRTNTTYIQNLVSAALAAGVEKFILISFPHVEGETTPESPALGLPDGSPDSAHARTRLAAEKFLFSASQGTNMQPVVLRAGMIYGRGVLMIEAARWLLQHHLLAVWRRPTWEHLLALPDFLEAVKTSVEKENVSGIYNVADDQPVTLQAFLDTIAANWGYARPWRFPEWVFPVAASSVEAFAFLFGTKAPLTRDFIRIGRASSVADTTRMKRELLPTLAYPTLKAGIVLL